MQTSMPKTTAVTSTPRKTLRWILRIASGLLVLVIVIFVIGVLINLKDEPLSAEAQALLVAPTYVADPSKNAYFVLRAMDADEGLDVLFTGREITAKYERLARENPNRTDYDKQVTYKKAPKSTWEVNRCKAGTENCVETDMRNRPKLEALLANNKLWLQRYEMMQQLPEFEEHPIYTVAAPMPAYTFMTQASDMALTRAVFEIADGRVQNGIDQLQRHDLFARKLLRRSSTLIQKMGALAMMRRQARTVSELVEIYPNLVEQHGDAFADLTRPMSLAERSLVSAFTSEAKVSVAVMRNLDFYHNMLSNSPTTEGASESPHMVDRVAGLFFQRNASANMMASSRSYVIREANVPLSEYSLMRQRLIDHELQLVDRSYTRYVYNSVGKLLYEIGVDSAMWGDYMERSVDVDGYLRLVGLQIDLRRKKIADAAIQDYVSKADVQFRSPYDRKPMTWVADQKQLQFIGRQKASGNPDGKNIFIAQMR